MMEKVLTRRTKATNAPFLFVYNTMSKLRVGDRDAGAVVSLFVWNGQVEKVQYDFFYSGKSCIVSM